MLDNAGTTIVGQPITLPFADGPTDLSGISISKR